MTPLETPIASSLVVVMSAKELRLCFQVPTEISLEVSDDPTTSTAEECFPISSLVKQFLHFTRAPRALVHPNVCRMLTGYSVQNSLYQPDISPVEIFFIYTLKLGTEDHLSMSAHSSRT